MSRRSLKHCTFCGPEVVSVGKYFLPRQAGCESGWMAVCATCADDFGRFQKIQYFAERANPATGCQHKWDKKNLVTQDGGSDEMICTACMQLGRRYGLDGEIQIV